MAIRGFTGWVGTVLDTPDPQRLAQFYSDLLGFEHTVADPTWVTMHLRTSAGDPSRATLAFQYEPDHERPTWPATSGTQQMQCHLDIAVANLADATADAIALGATLAPHQPQSDVNVLLDPDGHPFCLWTDTRPA